MKAKPKFSIATLRLVNEKRKVSYMCRVKTDNPRDSGWRFFCGDEDAEYLSDPRNMTVCTVNDIEKMDDSISMYMGSVEGLAFKWNKKKKEFVIQ